MSGDHYGVGDRYMDHAGYRPPSPPSAPPAAKRFLRCPSTFPADRTIQCIHTASSAHQLHTGWKDDTRVEWQNAPTGPRNQDEWEAAAWELTGGLGLEIAYDPGDMCLRIKHDAVAKWWDALTTKDQLVASYLASRNRA